MSEVLADERRLAAAGRYIEVGQPDRALQALAGMTPESAADPYAVRLRGFAHLALEDYDRAAACAHEGLAEEPDDIGLLYLLSVAETQRVDLAAAEQAILAALAVEPADAELLAQYGDVLIRAGQLDKAEQVLGRAAAADPDAPHVLERKIMLAHVRHDDRRAEQLSAQLLERDPESLAGQQMLGAFAWQRGDAKGASQRFAEVVRNDPANLHSADSARTLRRLSNPLWWSTRLLMRFGVARTWIAAVAIIFALNAAGLDTLALVATGVWVAICVMSWIAAAVFRDA